MTGQCLALCTHWSAPLRPGESAVQEGAVQASPSGCVTHMIASRIPTRARHAHAATRVRPRPSY
jgi:hypothetical protein